MHLLALTQNCAGHRRRILLLTSCTLFLLAGTTLTWQFSRSVYAQSQKTQTKLSYGQKANLANGFGQMPLYFIENRGQLNQSDKTLYFTSQGVTFSLRQPEKDGYTLKLDLVGANRELKLVGQQQTEAVISYFKGKENEQHRGLKTYREVIYRDAWPGIDLVYGGTVNQLKYSFIVHPGANPNQIKLAWRGANRVKVNEAGQMKIETPVENLKDEKPISYQEIDGKRVEIATSYKLAKHKGKNGSTEYGFELGEYDRSQELIVDPAMILYCGFIGGSDSDSGSDIAVDAMGNAYITGTAYSTEASFPVKIGPNSTHKGKTDAFVAKVKADGTDLVYCGYIGGSDTDYGTDIAVDATGNAYITGYTNSTEASFPVKIGPDLTFNGGTGLIGDAFVAKIKADGSDIDYCGYIGGASDDSGNGIAVNAVGNAYIIGTTQSGEATFPVRVGPDLTFNGKLIPFPDAFVAKIKVDGSDLDYCGYIGGESFDVGIDIAVDAMGDAYITGHTDSDEMTFPVRIGPYLAHNNGNSDVFVAKVKADGTDLIYCGYIGGSDSDRASSIAIDASGNAYVTGDTSSTETTFPVSIGPDLTHNGGIDAFVAKVKADGSGLDYCGYIGGSNNDYGYSIAVGPVGNAYITGGTRSTEMNFPVGGGPDLTHNGGADAFIARVKADGLGLDYCGYIGGSSDDFGRGIAVDVIGNAYVVGNTTSTESTFPVSGGPDLAHNGNSDAFIAKIGECPSISLSPTSLFNGWFGYPYSHILTASGGLAPYTFTVSAGELPPGLSLATDGTLSGTPAASGNYSFTITTTDTSGCMGRQDYAISVFTCDVVLWPRSLPNGELGVAYPTQTLTVTGGSAPYRFYVSGGTLPPGLSLTTNGILSGTPTMAGRYVIGLVAIDANGCIGGLDYTITVR